MSHDSGSRAPAGDAPAQSPVDSAPVTQLLIRWRRGSPEALDELMALVYDDLRRVARRRLGARQSIAATEVVHEAYGKLVGVDIDWQDRAHFFAVAANIVRRVLVDATRAKLRQKRGGGAVPVTFEEQLQPGDDTGSTDLLALDEALERLAQLDERKAKVVELHYFGGLSQPEVGEALGISVATVERDLKTARAFLHRELG